MLGVCILLIALVTFGCWWVEETKLGQKFGNWVIRKLNCGDNFDKD